MSGINQQDTHRTIERVARESYGRLVANLSSHTRDVASAEDAFGNALVGAVTSWPRDGVPQNPEAWLPTAARHSLIDVIRQQRVVAEANGPEAGLAVLESIDPDAVAHYQPYWAVRAHLLQRLGKTHEATGAYDRAIGPAADPAVREFLLQRRG